MSALPLRVAVAGASGFIGSALVRTLVAAGHGIVRIGRGAGNEVRWDPVAGEIDIAALPPVDVIVNLAGANIAQRWTARARRAIRESRLRGTDLLARAATRLSPRPALFLSASAMGIYGSRGDEWLDERSTLGDDFLAETGRAWEAAAEPARDAGIRVVHPRFGLVLDPAGGALAKMLPVFRIGAGGPLGRGTQWMSWISMPDLIGALRHAMVTPAINGAMNAVGPEPVTNATFAATLGRVLHRPAVIPAPEFALRLAFGEMASGTVLASQRVRPAVLEASGFAFAHRSLTAALRAVLGLA
jgi:hypothetical protein